MLVLDLLAEEPGHGYELRQRMADRSSHYFQPALGRLYPLLEDMERRNLVKGRWHLVGEARQRHVYTITTKGRRELAHRRDTWNQYVRHVQLVLSGKPVR